MDITFEDIKTTAKTLENQGLNPISDKDLNISIKTLEPIVEALDAFGPKYHLAWKELYFILKDFKGYKYNRELKKS